MIPICLTLYFLRPGGSDCLGTGRPLLTMLMTSNSSISACHPWLVPCSGFLLKTFGHTAGEPKRESKLFAPSWLSSSRHLTGCPI
ncbi:hypothetical protein HDV57DRAFT_505474 [Trichoderma longibrachiatum]